MTVSHQNWNAQQITALLPSYRHALDHDADYEPMATDRTVTVSRETWHNAKAALEMFESRQILRVQEVHRGLTDDVSLISFLKSRVAESLSRRAADQGLVVFGPIDVEVLPGRLLGEEDVFVATAVGIRPFEWKRLYS